MKSLKFKVKENNSQLCFNIIRELSLSVNNNKNNLRYSR